MSNFEGKLTEENEEDVSNQEKNLVLSINKNGKIIRFNRECEKITGFSRNEILNSKITDFLISEQYSERWKKYINFEGIENSINNFTFPLYTQGSKKVTVSWRIFPLKNIEGTIEEIGLVGELTNSIDDPYEYSTMQFETKLDKLKDNFSNSENENNGFNKNEEEKSILRTNEPPAIKDSENNTEKYSINENKRKKLEKINKTRKKLKIGKRTKEEENNRLEKNIDKIKNKQIKKSGQKRIFLNIFNFLFNSLNERKKKEEFERIMQELDIRRVKLKNLESQIITDKKNNKVIREELSNWRVKLESLEGEIDRRKTYIEEKEKRLSDNNISSLEENGPKEPQNVFENTTSNDENSNFIQISDKNNLNEINESAALIQRGTLKQINDSFANLLGYNPEEIVDKSLFDFIEPDSYPILKKHYLNRLTGIHSSPYKAVFLAKDGNKIPVDVDSRPTNFNGNRAEIIIIENKQLKNVLKEGKK